MFIISWLYDIRDYMAGFEFVFTDSKDASIFQFGIHGLKPFSSSRNTFYAGAGLSHNAFTAKEETARGLGVDGKFGYLIGRGDSVNFRIELGVTAGLFTHQNSRLLFPNISVGIGF
ncbi:MAG: hypothetical protein HYW48_10930 [Deltaproteobacteria bacterium]|nr:hypothetical protein [Deltaproteobacteria bacterium]